LSSSFRGPMIPLANAFPQVCQTHGIGGACSEFWYPAGPEEDTFQAMIFTDQTAEFNSLQSTSPTIDFPDSPIPANAICVPDLCNPFIITAPVSQTGYYEIQFMMANNFWGCNFNFGNSTCGSQIRQGIAHMIDKTSFTNTDPTIAGISTPIDNPVPTSSAGGLLSPNPCGYDSSFPQSGTSCIVGAPGGTSYHLGNSTGTDGYPWLQAPGSKDLNAAAQHFVNAGLASGFNPATSILTGVSSAAALHPIQFFIRNDDPVRLDLGKGLEAQICYVFTGSYTVPCAYLSVTLGPATAFPGFTTSTSSVSQDWWMYTAFYNRVPFFDDSLYYNYNSRFVSGIASIQPIDGPCSSESAPSNSGSDYMYLCNPSYDSMTNQMEFAACTITTGDPVPGQTSNNSTGTCLGTSSLSAVGAGIESENLFGKNAFTLPIFERTLQFAYPSTGWTRVINDNQVGLPNFFTWLNAWNPSPPAAGTIRQGFSQTTRSVNPFIASTPQDLYVVGNVYDSLSRLNPLDQSQSICWMTYTCPQQLPLSALTYTPPPGTVTSVRFTLRSDLSFQDGTQVTAFDAGFSYLALLEAGSPLGGVAVPISGVTLLGPRQFDLNLGSIGPFTLSSITSLPILPAAYWTNSGMSTWSNNVNKCSTPTAPCYPAQYTLAAPAGPVACALTCVFSASLMNVNPSDTSASFDPVAHHMLVGSGPWECGPVTNSGSGNCSTCSPLCQMPGPGGGYTLTRFGAGLAPGSSINGIYFRSSGNLAVCIWSLTCDKDLTQAFLEFSVIASCYGVPVTSTGPCAHFQQGIGAVAGGGPVGLSQVAIVNRFVGAQWVSPFNWSTSPPIGITPPNPVLYENTITLNPASIAGCTTPYPTGGYDC
jgi:hypothetical protein